jgi:chromosome segregation ATPase
MSKKYSKSSNKSSNKSSGSQPTLLSFGYSSQIRNEEQIRNELRDVVAQITNKQTAIQLVPQQLSDELERLRAKENLFNELQSLTAQEKALLEEIAKLKEKALLEEIALKEKEKALMAEENAQMSKKLKTLGANFVAGQGKISSVNLSRAKFMPV